MIDLHNDALLALPSAQLRTYLQQAKCDGVTEIWLSIWTTQLPDPMGTIKAKKRLLDKLMGDPAYPICRLHIEDAWFLTPENLATFIKLQPHSVGLTWNDANALAGGAHSHRGITPWGRQVIAALESAGIQIDTAHLNRRSFYQFARVTTRPLLCTHTALNAIRRHPRNLTNRQIRTIVKSGGMIGLCVVPDFLTLNTTSCSFYDYVKHYMYYIKHFGCDSLCIGTDFCGTDTLPDGIDSYRDLQGIDTAMVIGNSVLHRPLVAYQFGNPSASKRLLITGGMHAREWLTIDAVRGLISLCSDLPRDVGVVLVPNCNPDGVLLATKGLTTVPRWRRRRLRRLNQNRDNFHLWKANARAVDLNVNFDAGWGQGHSNLTTPATANYIGRHPNSEPENKALLRLIKSFRPTVSVALHSKGEVVYYSRIADRDTAQKIADLTQYRAVMSANSYGGLTDYLALKCGVPSFTIEIGNDRYPHPLGKEHLPDIMSRLQKVFYLLTGA